MGNKCREIKGVPSTTCSAGVQPQSIRVPGPILQLTLKKKWFDMIASGEKKEEYRELKQYWFDRLCYNNPVRAHDMVEFKEYKTIIFRNGYGKYAPCIIVECEGIRFGKGNSEWGGTGDDVFIIKLGRIYGK